MKCVNIVHVVAELLFDSEDKTRSDPSTVFPEEDYKRFRNKSIKLDFFLIQFLNIIFQRVNIWGDFKGSTGFLSGPSLVQRSGT